MATEPSQKLSTDPNAIPTAEVLVAAWDVPVRDRTGKELPFKDVVAGPGVPPRVLVIFVRHWFCPTCQTYIRKLVAKVTPEILSNLPVATSIAIIGSGGPQLIDHWARESACPFPIYSDKSLKLYKLFDFRRDEGQKGDSEYVDQSTFQGFLTSASQFVRKPHRIPQTGHPYQNGGELLFEPVSPSGEGKEEEGRKKEVTWCHRMQHSGDHAKFADVFRKLGIDEG